MREASRSAALVLSSALVGAELVSLCLRLIRFGIAPACFTIFTGEDLDYGLLDMVVVYVPLNSLL